MSVKECEHEKVFIKNNKGKVNKEDSEKPLFDLVYITVYEI